MIRLFPLIAGVNTAALLAALVSGLISWWGKASESNLDIYLLHFVLGLTAALTTLFVHCLVLTYFLGTGRWVKEVCLAYGLPDQEMPRQTREIKRRNTPRVILAMLVTIAAAAAGAAAQQRVWPGWVHLVLALVTVLLNVYVFFVEYGNMRINVRILDSVMSDVDRIRAERGLPSNEEALRNI